MSAPPLVAPAGAPPLPASAPRALSLLDAIGIGINGIVGSGVYLLVGPLAWKSGSASVVGVMACGLLCMLIALCFAELSSMYDRSGGPYLYARAAFGPLVGFAVGWLGAATGILGLAAVARGFADALARLWPAMDAWPGSRTLLAAALICALGLINYLGVKAGGRTSTVLSLVKIAPLVLLAVIGLPHLSGEVLSGMFHAPPGAPGAEPRSWFGAVSGAAFLAIFMTSGFEYATVPAGEVRDARRAVPLALLASLLFATLLYAALQLVALSVLPALRTLPPAGPGPHAQALVDVAERLLGPRGVPFLGAAALLSMAGFCSAVALVAPRYFLALAEDRMLPAGLLRLSRFGTPGPAILAATALSCGLAVVLGFARLVDVSNVVILTGYIGTCLAALVLRLRNPGASRAVRLPFGPLLPLLAAAAATTLLISARPRPAEWLFALELTALGLALWGITVLARRLRRGRQPSTP